MFNTLSCLLSYVFHYCLGVNSTRPCLPCFASPFQHSCPRNIFALRTLAMGRRRCRCWGSLPLDLHSPLPVPAYCCGSSSAHPPAPPIHRRCFFTRKLFTSCAIIAGICFPEFFAKAFACLISFGSLGLELTNASLIIVTNMSENVLFHCTVFSVALLHFLDCNPLGIRYSQIFLIIRIKLCNGGY